MRVYFLYSKFSSGENLHGAATGIKDFIFGDKKKNKILRHTLPLKKAGRKKRTIIPGIVGFYFVKQH